MCIVHTINWFFDTAQTRFLASVFATMSEDSTDYMGILILGQKRRFCQIAPYDDYFDVLLFFDIEYAVTCYSDW